MKQFLTIDAASLMLGKGKSTIWRWITDGKLSKTTISGRACVDLQELMDTEAEFFIDKRERMKNFNDTRKKAKSST
jgi:hypothetical protein